MAQEIATSPVTSAEEQKLALEFSSLCAKYHLTIPQALSTLREYPWHELKSCQYQSSRITLCSALCPSEHVFCNKHAQYAKRDQGSVVIDVAKGEIRRYAYIPELGKIELIAVNTAAPSQPTLPPTQAPSSLLLN